MKKMDILQIGLFEHTNSRWDEKMRLRAYIGGVFRTSRIYEGMDFVPGTLQSFNNPPRYDNIEMLRSEYPELAGKIESMGNEGVHEIDVYEAALFDEKPLSLIKGLAFAVVEKEVDDTQLDILEEIRKNNKPLILTKY